MPGWFRPYPVVTERGRRYIMIDRLYALDGTRTLRMVDITEQPEVAITRISGKERVKACENAEGMLICPMVHGGVLPLPIMSRADPVSEPPRD